MFGSVSYNKKSIPVANGHPQHNHPANPFGLAAAAFIVSVENRCREEVSPVPAIYDEMVGQLNPMKMH
jgi:hypothetical protein